MLLLIMDILYRHAKQNLLIHNATERIATKVDRRGPDECWPWIGSVSKSPNGDYGALSVRVGSRSLHVQAHRLVYWIERGAVEDGLLVRHICNNTLCCNARHLAVGTTKDNSDDMVKAGRVCRGERHRRTKLTEQQVRTAREQSAEGTTVHEIATTLNIVEGSLYQILCGKHVGGPLHKTKPFRAVVSSEPHGQDCHGIPYFRHTLACGHLAVRKTPRPTRCRCRQCG